MAIHESFVAVHESFVAVHESFLREIWSVASFGAANRAIQENFLHENYIFHLGNIAPITSN